jgi:hypothetical protein
MTTLTAQLAIVTIALIVVADCDNFLRLQRWLEQRDYRRHFED